MKYINVARKIIKSYLNENQDFREIALLLNEEADNKYEYLKVYITTIRDNMNKALKEIDKNEK